MKRIISTVLYTFLASLFLITINNISPNKILLGNGTYSHVYSQIKSLEPSKFKIIGILSTIIINVPTSPVINCGDNYYANFIYSHESGCRLNAINSIGALGIGQAWPGNKLTSICPNLDYICENTFFNNYAISNYGSWQNAYDFWVSNHWW